MLKIDVVSDIVCPWCFIGKRRLEAALAIIRKTHVDFACETRWHPFFLNPDTPPEGEPYRPFLERKFGGSTAVEAHFELVRAAGLNEGIDYAFDKIRLRANTLQAHRLLYWAQQRGNADTLVERLFVAQFQKGEAVGDLGTLVRIAAECGYQPDEVTSFLHTDENITTVREEERRIRATGINSVPTFILNQQNIIVGAADPTILARAILQ